MTPDSNLGRYLEQIRQLPLLSANRERELAQRMIGAHDEEARRDLVRSNLRLVVHVAKRYARRGVALADLIQDGNLGLLRAADKFNPELNIRFSSYAIWWIRLAIRRGLLGTNAIHIPAHMAEQISRWKRALSVLQERLGRMPNLEEIARYMRISWKEMRILHRACRANHCPRPADSAEGEDLGTFRTETVPEDAVLDDETIHQMQLVLDRLEPRQAEILRLHYGLEGRAPLTLQRIAGQYGLSRERVRQLEKEALAKLKTHLTSGRLPAEKPADSDEALAEMPQEAEAAVLS